MWEHSRTARVLQTVTARLTQIREGSVLLGTVERLTARTASVARNSYCYRWLTTEPDPEVIVIDLHQSRTVGPFIRPVANVLSLVAKAWAGSRVAAIMTALDELVAGSRTGRVLAALLAPPESSADSDGENG